MQRIILCIIMTYAVYAGGQPHGSIVLGVDGTLQARHLTTPFSWMITG